MDRMFNKAVKFDKPIGDWDVSKVTNMADMFAGGYIVTTGWIKSIFNQDISKWNVSNVTNMTNMFQDNIKFNQNISCWQVPKITSTPSYFASYLNSEKWPRFGQIPNETCE